MTSSEYDVFYCNSNFYYSCSKWYWLSCYFKTKIVKYQNIKLDSWPENVNNRWEEQNRRLSFTWYSYEIDCIQIQNATKYDESKTANKDSKLFSDYKSTSVIVGKFYWFDQYLHELLKNCHKSLKKNCHKSLKKNFHKSLKRTSNGLQHMMYKKE